MTAIIDGDIIIYQSLPRDESIHIKVAQERYLELISEITECCFDTEFVTYVGGKDNFRKEYDWYKANRRDRHKHRHLAPMRKWAVSTGLAVPADGAEADDYILCRARECRRLGKPFAICSIDKDLRTFPGVHLNTNYRQLDYVDSETARTNYFIQLLTGDSTDNILGLAKVGPIKARKYLDQFEPEVWPQAVSEFWRQRHPEDWLDRLTGVWNTITIRTQKDEFKIMDLPDEFQI